MKNIILGLVLLSLGACSSLATVMQGAGNGMVEGGKNRQSYTQSRPVHCTSDLIGGYNCQ